MIQINKIWTVNSKIRGKPGKLQNGEKNVGNRENQYSLCDWYLHNEVANRAEKNLSIDQTYTGNIIIQIF